MGVSSPKLNLLATDNGIKFILAPKSQIAFLISNPQMVHGIVKLPGSFIFSGKFFFITALQVAIRFTTPSSANLLFLLKISFRNLA